LAITFQMSSKKTLPTGPDRLSIYCPRDLGKRPHVSYWDETGERVRITKGLSKGNTYEERLRACELLLESIRSEFVPTSTLEDLCWDWIESRRPYLRLKSFYGYQSKLRLFLKWKDGRAMSKQLVTEYFAYRAVRVSGGTLKDDKIYLNRILTSVSSERYFDHLDLPRFYAVTKKHYQRRQIKIIRDHLQENDPELWFVCQCVYYLFIRPGSELRLLRAHHFDLDEWRVNIPPSISKNRKNDYVTIPKQFRNEVENYLHGIGPNEYIFPSVRRGGKDLNRADKPISANTWMSRYRKHLDHLRFGSEYTMYGWKNTGAIACVKAGIHPKILQLQLRHSSLEMTDRYLRRMGIMDTGDLAEKFPAI
jgi:integrase